MDESIIFSPPTDWLRIERSTGKNEQIGQPIISLLTAVSDTALQLHWNYTVPDYMNSPETFLISYAKTSDEKYAHTVSVPLQWNSLAVFGSCNNYIFWFVITC